jgi:hypothetical protein
LVVLLAVSLSAFGQTNTAPISGVVTDPQGAVIPGAQIEVLNVDTGLVLKATTSERGEWVLPGMSSGTYRVTVTMAGFKKATLSDITMNAGIPVAANAKLEIGQTSEIVTITGAAEIVQTSSATVTNTLQTQQVFELPFTSRNGMDLLVTLPGTQTAGTARTSFINGLPLSAINVTMDGVNTQDNYYKSGDGFFTLIPARPDSLEEITLSTSAAGADSSAGGAAQVKFVTKGGTNNYRGSAFWQHRNTALNANSYFNNINGQPRNKVILNQGGINIGGPILKDRLLFFNNYEIYRYPAQTNITRTVLTPDAITGNFSYVSGGATKVVNVLDLAGKNGFTGTADPMIKDTLTKINGYTQTGGTLRSRIPTNTDYNRYDLLFQPKGLSKNTYNTTRLDWNITQKHSFQVIYTYFVNKSVPDITNSVTQIFPGTGIVVGYDDVQPSQGGNRYSFVSALRSSLTSKLTNELRFGLNRSITLFRAEISPTMFGAWKGYAPTLGFGLTNPQAVAGSSRRTSPVRELHDSATWLKGSHVLSFGVDLSQINLWYQTVGTSVIPTISFNGLATGDPINTGSTGIFTTTNFPGANTTNLSDARSLYATLTARVASITRSLALDGDTKKYANVPPTERDRMMEWGLFAQDSWKVNRDLTLNLGLRFERQGAFINRDGTYSAVSYQSLWGLSGPGNMFTPGTLSGIAPTIDPYTTPYKTPNMWNPSIGVAWRMPGFSGLLGSLLGKEGGKSVLRAGYNISTVRESTYVFQSLYGSNPGFTYSTSVDPGNYPTDFGAPGSVLLRNATLPVRSGVPSAPQYPMTPTVSNSLNGFDPNLRMGYVQSWNIGYQRELTKSMVLEVRYTGNHGIKLWRQVNLNEINTIENGFLKEFDVARNNLFINRKCSGSVYSPAAWANCASPSVISFANNSLPGQGPIPIIQTAFGTSDTTWSDYLRQGRAGTIANTIATNATYFGRLKTAGYPANMFQVNPTVASGGAWLLTNQGQSYFNSLQVDLNRRMSSGVLFQGSYTLAKSAAIGAMSDLGNVSQPTTFRNTGLDKGPSAYDIRHAFKFNAILELPFGPGKRFASGVNSFVGKVIGGWQLSGISRIQSGSTFQLTSARATINTQEAGITLNNITLDQLQSMMQIRKTTGSDGKGIVSWLPDSIINNTNAAFETNGKTWANLDPNAPYIGPQLVPNSFGYRIFLRNPWQYQMDLMVLKKTRITERNSFEFRASFLNVLNLTNFFIANGPSSTSFGRTTSYYNDFSGSANPGSRVIEFQLRLTF